MQLPGVGVKYFHLLLTGGYYPGVAVTNMAHVVDTVYGKI